VKTLSLSLSLKKNKLSKREKIAVLSRDATRKEAYKECVKERVFFLVLMSFCVFRVLLYTKSCEKKVETRLQNERYLLVFR